MFAQPFGITLVLGLDLAPPPLTETDGKEPALHVRTYHCWRSLIHALLPTLVLGVPAHSDFH